jgi:acyl-CoA thioester hydrolase
MMHETRVRVRYADVDAMGFAYYAHYLRWFEVGRAEMLRALGTSYREVEASGLWLPVLEARCRYLAPARYDDEIAIATGVLELRRAAVRFGYDVRRVADGERLAVGSTQHCFLARDGRPARPTPALAALLVRAPRAAADLGLD